MIQYFPVMLVLLSAWKYTADKPAILIYPYTVPRPQTFEVSPTAGPLLAIGTIQTRPWQELHREVTDFDLLQNLGDCSSAGGRCHDVHTGNTIHIAILRKQLPANLNAFHFLRRAVAGRFQARYH